MVVRVVLALTALAFLCYAQEPKIKSQKDVEKLLAEIKREREVLAEREEYIKRREERLKLLERRIDRKLKEMKDILDRMNKLLSTLTEKEKAEVARLTKVLESMKPNKAGPIFDQLDTRIAARILLGMNERKAAKILNFVSPKKSVEITEEIARQKEKLKEAVLGTKAR